MNMHFAKRSKALFGLTWPVYQVFLEVIFAESKVGSHFFVLSIFYYF